MKTSFLYLCFLPLTASAVSLRVEPDSDQFFSTDYIRLSCGDGGTVKRDRTGQVQTCGDFGKIRGSSCVLSSAVPSDSGWYWCESGSGSGPQRPLSVTDSDLILESPGLPVEAGSDVTLRCRTRNGSGLIPVIHRNRTLFQSSSEWTITRVSKQDQGLYSCSDLKDGAPVRSAERELRVKDAPPTTTPASPTFSILSTFVPPSSSPPPPSPESSPESSPPPLPPEFCVQWVLLRLLVGSPYCVCTVLLVWIYSGQRPTGSPRAVSMETGQQQQEEEEEYDDVGAEVTTEHHF